MRMLFFAALGAASITTSAANAAGPQPAFNWTGFYVGGNVGGMWSRSEVGDLTGPVFPAYLFINGGIPTLILGQIATLPGATGNSSALMGGLQAGYNWQMDRFVLGFEADVDGTRIRNTATSSASRVLGLPTQIVSTNYTTSIDWTASLRLRAGVSFDRALIYVTGGPALARIKLDTNTTMVAPAGSFLPVGSSTAAGSGSSTRVGWTFGIGGEWALNNAWSIAAEYRRTNFGTFSATNAVQIPDGLGTIFATGSPDVRVSTDQVTARLNYRFGGR
jgi:outer membrane immunogenic protein